MLVFMWYIIVDPYVRISTECSNVHNYTHVTLVFMWYIVDPYICTKCTCTCIVILLFMCFLYGILSVVY